MQVLDRLLTPLAVLAVRKGWLYPAVADRLRHAYLRAARKDAGARATDSKVSVMTGLQRRDIARLKGDTAPPSKPQRQPLAEIIALWWDDPAYDTAQLPVLGDTGSFTHLAWRVRKDVHPRTFLDLLKQAGAVEEQDATLRLLKKTYIPASGSDDQLAYLVDHVGDHLSVAVGNVTKGQDDYDVSVHYQGLSPEAINTLDALWRRRMAEVMDEMNTAARAMGPDQNGSFRFRAGGYFHKEDT